MNAPIMPMPTAARPLLGATILLVEDSRFASEAMRLMCLRSGARIRRADTLAAADRHLRAYAPTAAIVDLGLPDGDGEALIARLRDARPRTCGVIGLSGDGDGEARARAAGADGFLAKPLTSLAAFQQAVLAVLPPEVRPPGPRPLSLETVRPDRVAFHDDMAHASAMLAGAGEGGAAALPAGYVAQFLAGVARAMPGTPPSPAPPPACAPSRSRTAPPPRRPPSWRTSPPW